MALIMSAEYYKIIKKMFTPLKLNALMNCAHFYLIFSVNKLYMFKEHIK